MGTLPALVTVDGLVIQLRLHPAKRPNVGPITSRSENATAVQPLGQMRVPATVKRQSLAGRATTPVSLCRRSSQTGAPRRSRVHGLPDVR